MVSYKDFEDENGKIDWTAVRQAEIDAGEKCYRCRKPILFAKGYRCLCRDCEIMDKDEGDVTSGRQIRCPKCGYQEAAVADCDDNERYAEGNHTVYCGECDHEYEIETLVTYIFESPVRLKVSSSDD